MDVLLVKLSELRQRRRSSDRGAFARDYPGAFLLAMGYLSSEVLRARSKPSAIAIEPGGRRRADETTALTFGSRLRHDALASHPLAGCAFFLRPTGERSSLLLGRGKYCDLTVPETSVSEEHCRIEVTDRAVLVVDLGSTNGTNLNLVRIDPGEPNELADEDVLTVGRYSFQLLTAATMYSELALLDELEA